MREPRVSSHPLRARILRRLLRRQGELSEGGQRGQLRGGRSALRPVSLRSLVREPRLSELAHLYLPRRLLRLLRPVPSRHCAERLRHERRCLPPLRIQSGLCARQVHVLAERLPGMLPRRPVQDG